MTDPTIEQPSKCCMCGRELDEDQVFLDVNEYEYCAECLYNYVLPGDWRQPYPELEQAMSELGTPMEELLQDPD